MNILIAPDSFKGSLSSLAAGRIIQRAFQEILPTSSVVIVPMADGGEGTLDSLLYITNGQRFQLETVGPLNEPLTIDYGVLGENETAVVETAQIVGMPLIKDENVTPLRRSTFGIGAALKKLMNQGHRNFIIGIGGSATNDGGIGMLQALGATFLDKQGNVVEPNCYGMLKVDKADFSTLDPLVKQCHFKIACDVNNPLCGKNGATAIFGPQKGIAPEQINTLDSALYRYATMIETHLNIDIKNEAGTGAAGGLGYAFLTIGGMLVSGAKLISDYVKLTERINMADVVITGEGQSDYQTLYGKVPGYIGKLAKMNGKKAILLSGSLGDGYEKLYNYFISCESIIHAPLTLEQCLNNAEELLYKKAKNIAHLLKYSNILGEEMNIQ